MQQNKTFLRKWIAGAGAVTLLLGAGSAGAVTRPMVGAMGVFNPSVAAPFLFEGGVAVFGKKQGVYPPSAGWKTVNVTGAAGTTMAGRAVTIMAGMMNIAGGKARGFPAFPNVGQTTKTFMTDNQSAMFAVGGGALAGCPGPGCNLNGAGTEIEFCPPLAHNPANPAPGTVANKAGDWDCDAYNAALAGNRAKRFFITNAAGAGAPHFGGTLTLLHSQNQNVWRVNVQPSTPMAPNAQVERSWMSINNLQWTPGRPNFEFHTNPGNNGPRIVGRLDGSGRVAQTFGCVNGVGTVGVGKTFMGVPGPIGPFLPILGPGNNCGTNTTMMNAPGQGWAFKATTGTLAGSDFFPFSTETTDVLGTPFNPHRVLRTYMNPGFFFTRMGQDTVAGTIRNIVLLGGGIAVDPGSGNAYDRLSTLRMRLQIPEPAAATGLLIGAGALLGLARRRR